MAKPNDTRVLLGSLLAGVVLLLGSLSLGALVSNEVVVAIFGRPQGPPPGFMAHFGYAASHLGLGMFAVWLYASIRPRFGPGPGTAIRAGLLTWFMAVVVPVNFQVVLGVTRPAPETGTTMLLVLAASALLYPLATLSGASIYREDEDPVPVSAEAQPQE